MRVALDAMGGDFAPDPNIHGAIDAVAQTDDLHVILVGDPAVLETKLSDALKERSEVDGSRLSIVESDGVERHGRKADGGTARPSRTVPSLAAGNSWPPRRPKPW